MLRQNIAHTGPSTGLMAKLNRQGDVAASGIVLVVEAHTQVRQTLGRALRGAGYAVIEAAHAAAGAEVMVGVALAACIIEITADDDAAGMRLGHALRETDPAVAILHTTGLEAWQLPAMPAIDPMTRFLRKPFGMRAMIEVLGRLCGRRIGGNAGVAPKGYLTEM